MLKNTLTRLALLLAATNIPLSVSALENDTVIVDMNLKGDTVVRCLDYPPKASPFDKELKPLKNPNSKMHLRQISVKRGQYINFKRQNIPGGIYFCPQNGLLVRTSQNAADNTFLAKTAGTERVYVYMRGGFKRDRDHYPSNLIIVIVN